MSAKKSNFLILMVDQWRADALACAGHPLVQTPNLDRLAAEGVRFDNAFTPSPICTPARASFYTGTYPHIHGARTNNVRPSAPLPMLADMLGDAGYTSFHAGKWHIGTNPDPAYGFDQVVTDHGDYYDFLESHGIDWTTGSSTQRLMASPDQPHEGRFEHGVEMSRPHYLVDQTINFLETDPDDPFFAVCSFYGPHAPYEVPEPYYSMYNPDDITLPESFYEDWSDKPEALRNWRPGKWSRDWPEDKWKRIMAGYFAFITHIDAEIGRLLDALGHAENTVVIFIADHGEMNGSHRFLYKGPYFFEEVLRIPLIVRLPGGQRSGETESALVSLLDVFPTILDLAGVPVPEQAQGKSLVDLLHEQAASHHNYIYSELHDFAYGAVPVDCPMRCYRDTRWKYVERLPIGVEGEELYDLENDPGELHNLAKVSEYNQIRETLNQSLRAAAAALNDDWPQPGEN